MTKKILIDTDPGVDDAAALLCALHSSEFEIMGLTTTFGNTGVEYTTLNALRILELKNRIDIPVARGCGHPLLLEAELGTFVHGEDGFGNSHMPLPVNQPIKQHAVDFIIKTILANPGEITLLPIGPLTNIAVALRMEPRITSLIKEVVIMGGAATVPGNMTPVAEANFYNDPHAAAVVINAGWPLTMVGLDVCSPVVVSDSMLNEIFHANTPATHLIETILPFYRNYLARFLGMTGVDFPDVIALAYLIDPSLFETHTWPIFVQTDGRCRGQSIPDTSGRWEDLPPIQVCTGINVPAVLDLFKNRIIQ